MSNCDHNLQLDDEHRKATCEKRGLRVVLPEANQLQVDIDSFEALGVFAANVERLGDLVESHVRTVSPSRKSGHYHVTVTLKRPVRDPMERILLQLLLGSDVTRELLSWKRATADMADPTIFFERAEDKQSDA